jgi:hypothetical protein
MTTGNDGARADVELTEAKVKVFPDDYGWDDLMALLDAHWPDDIFPTTEDREARDPGPRIVSLLRWVDRLRAVEAERKPACLCVETVRSAVMDAAKAEAALAEARQREERVRALLSTPAPPKRDEKGNYDGRVGGGEHRTTGQRAWCYGCSEWCAESYACPCCEPKIEPSDLRIALGGDGA